MSKYRTLAEEIKRWDGIELFKEYNETMAKKICQNCLRNLTPFRTTIALHKFLDDGLCQTCQDQVELMNEIVDELIDEGN